ncbi:MAG TPA: phosphoribosyltransferase, partial [Isosphaeraceae bacterium]
MEPRFRDRREAGRVLARKLAKYAGRDDVIVLALPRGGVPVAYEVARALNAPLDVFLVRKLGVPGHEELAMGAIASGGVRALYQPVVRGLGIPDEVIDEVADAERDELDRRAREYRDGRPEPDLKGKIAILVDDGLATGASMRAAVEALRRAGPKRIVVAVPVAAPSTCEEFRGIADEVICARTPEPLRAVGIWYDDFSQTTDAEVRDLLTRASSVREARATGRSVRLPAGGVTLEGDLEIPQGATGVVLFAHGSGSSRHSPRNRRVAAALREGGLGTLLIDLLTAEEEAVDARTGHLRFDIGLLARRLVAAIDWLGARPETRHLKVGLFGASTGAGAALVAAAERPKAVGA